MRDRATWGLYVVYNGVMLASFLAVYLLAGTHQSDGERGEGASSREGAGRRLAAGDGLTRLAQACLEPARHGAEVSRRTHAAFRNSARLAGSSA